MKTLVAVLAMAALMLLAAPARGKTFVVTSPGDAPYPPSGPTPCSSAPSACTLRAALAEGNQSAGPHTITFAVPKVTLANGGGLELRAPFIITGTPTPRTIVDGGGLSCFSLTDASSTSNPKGANGSILSNLSIQHCSGDGISANGHGFKFLNNTIGTDVTGTTASAQTAVTGSGISVSSSHVYVALDSGSKVTSFLQNLYSSFPFPLPDLTLPDVSGQINKFSSNLLTALAALTDPVLITDNVIAGNGQHGISIFSENLAAVIVSGNRIGTDATGNKALPNGKSGVHFIGNPFGNLIGPGNVISGNTDHGVLVEGSTVLLPNFIMGNVIGLGVLPTASVGNGKSGIYVTGVKPSTAAAAYNATSLSLVVVGNVIGGNKGAPNSTDPDTLGADEAGIVITGNTSKVKVLGNRIGVSEFPFGSPVTGGAHGNAGDGIIVTSSDNVIGGAGGGAGNVIAANKRHGIVVKGSGTAKVVIQGNSIGVHPGLPGDLTLGNAKDGVHLNAASATTVGGAKHGEENEIAANKRHGIALRSGGALNGWANLFQRNLLYKNSSLGIDLEHPKNAADDPAHSSYPSNYPNQDQNQPVICTVSLGACAGSTAPSASGGSTKLSWTLEAKSSATYRLEFFRLDAASQAASTTMAFLGEQTVTADASGNLIGCTAAGRCTSTVPGTAVGYIVMTATDITKLVYGLGTPSWVDLLDCFTGKTCTKDCTSELSNVAPVKVSASAPVAVTEAATALTTSGATLNGAVTSNGAETTVTFAYGASTSYGLTATAKQSPLDAGAIKEPASAELTGLTCGTTYHFRVQAQNSVGSVNGDDRTFTTAACPPPSPDKGLGADKGLADSGPPAADHGVKPDSAVPTGSSDGGCATGGLPAAPTGLALLALLALALLGVLRPRTR